MVRSTKKQRGGAYAFGPQITPGLINNFGQGVLGGAPLIPDCVAAAKTDTIGYKGPQGLPGLSGGSRRKSRKAHGRLRGRSRKYRQMGGRYGFDLSAPFGSSAGPGMGGIPPVQKIACESASTTSNPLNQASQQALVGQKGGGTITMNPAYFAPTAGYDNTPSKWVASTGAPVLLQAPYEARAMNPACVKTGGSRRRHSRRRSGSHSR
jgi:hypothetical protein